MHQNRIRQSGLIAGGGGLLHQRERQIRPRAQAVPGKALSENQAIQWPLVELATQAEALRLLIRKTAWQMDRMEHKEIERQISDKVSM